MSEPAPATSNLLSDSEILSVFKIPNLAALDLLWCENQQEGNVDQDVGDGHN